MRHISFHADLETIANKLVIEGADTVIEFLGCVVGEIQKLAMINKLNDPYESRQCFGRFIEWRPHEASAAYLDADTVVFLTMLCEGAK